MLPHNGNKYILVPMGHSINMSKNMKNKANNWIICENLKMINFLLCQQSGYIRYPCFPSLWDSRVKHRHWVEKTLSFRKQLIMDEHNVINEPFDRSL